jgi:hypothetical protein
VIAKGERVLGSYPPLLYDTNSVNKEWFFFSIFFIVAS